MPRKRRDIPRWRPEEAARAYHELDQQVLQAFFALDTTDLEQVAAFIESRCLACRAAVADGRTGEEAYADCQQAGCGLLAAALLADEQAELRAVYNEFRDPKAGDEAVLDRFNLRTHEHGAASYGLRRRPDGYLDLGLYTGTLRAYLTSCLTLVLLGRGGATFGHVADWNAKEMARFHKSAREAVDQQEQYAMAERWYKHPNMAEVARRYNVNRRTVYKSVKKSG